MDSASRIAVGIVIAAVVLVVGYVGYHEFSRYRDIRDLKSTISGFEHQVAVDSASTRRASFERRQRDLFSRRLTRTQQCIAHTVVDVHGNNYVQLHDVRGVPIACRGRYATVSIR